MAKYLVMIAAALALSGCYTTRYDSASAGGTTPASGVKEARVQMDRDGRVETYATDYDLRRGDRVQVLANGKVGPL